MEGQDSDNVAIRLFFQIKVGEAASFIRGVQGGQGLQRDDEMSVYPLFYSLESCLH
ncbi:hypothetical protein JCM10914A_09310 [Paenibacillus sp. JCM 10914]|uniref:hypothetical protein n=1 Tax=Paenibacillus sp. JCM 10914 TaxID=1236974 RepID=UPI0003CC48E4|nr:hypothetical protein [Paenibacillus sp. JCM 10914]GAE07388.1 hypothetical protein JCM10914_3615 [Paenibacillus sp. JCM 10914]